MLPPSSARPSQIFACWLGKSIGGTLGLPAEGRMQRLHFSFYDPVPASAPPNDDLELQLVWLHLVETAGSSLCQADFARAWLRHIHYMWDEYGRCRWNLRRGVPLPSVGTFENPFHAGMGSPIRSEIWACLFPGDPDSAAGYAALDASLDHGPEGIAGEVLFASLQSLVAAGESCAGGLQSALRYLPASCESAQAVEFVLQGHSAALPEWECWRQLLLRHGSENFTHAPLNVALTIWALLYGGGNFEKSVLLAVNAGYDTDCTAATVGATLGLLLGTEGIPARWSAPIGDEIFVGPGIRGIAAPRTLGELTARTAALAGRLAPKGWDPSIWEAAPAPSLVGLPGTIWLDAGAGKPVAWANGELPAEVKQAGKARWTWRLAGGEPREIICLARAGARLFLDDELLIECPAGLPYVPATHRSAPGSRVRFVPKGNRHEVRLELASHDPAQEASVMLAYPNLHLCPWTASELPRAAHLLPPPG